MSLSLIHISNLISKNINEIISDIDTMLRTLGNGDLTYKTADVYILADKVRAFAQLRYFLVNFLAEVKLLLVKIAVR